MVGNVWFDAESDRLVYNIEDADYEATGGVGAPSPVGGVRLPWAC